MKKLIPITIVFIVFFMNAVEVKSHSGNIKMAGHLSTIVKEIQMKESQTLLLTYPSNESIKPDTMTKATMPLSSSETVTLVGQQGSEGNTKVSSSNNNNASIDSEPIDSKKTTQTPDQQFVKSNIKIGQSQKDVRELLGVPNAIGYTAMDGRETWRYDFVQIEGYVFEELQEFKEMAIVGTVDIEGLKNNQMSVQLFIQWNEGEIIHFASYVHDQGEVKEFRVFADGSIRETVIQ